MSIPRPYIPVSVRVQAAELQTCKLLYAGVTLEWWDAYQLSTTSAPSRLKLEILLEKLAQILGENLQLDHDPALILRKYKVDRRKPPAAWFTPNANDPAYLVYRPKREHLEKTVGRRADAEKTVTTKGSDIWLKTKFRRLEQPRKKPRAKIPARAKPWPKGRKLQGRPFPR